MSRPKFVLSPEALNDLDEIWLRIAGDNVDAADRVEREIRKAIRLLAHRPWRPLTTSGVNVRIQSLRARHATGIRFGELHDCGGNAGRVPGIWRPAVLMILTGLLAAYFPARSAFAVDPIRALREE